MNLATGGGGASGVGPSSSEGTFMTVKPTDARGGGATGAVDDDDAAVAPLIHGHRQPETVSY